MVEAIADTEALGQEDGLVAHQALLTARHSRLHGQLKVGKNTRRAALKAELVRFIEGVRPSSMGTGCTRLWPIIIKVACALYCTQTEIHKIHLVVIVGG